MTTEQVDDGRQQVFPTDAAAGAEVAAGPVNALDAAGFTQIRAAWLHHLVLLFRDQTLDAAQFRDFARSFGPLKPAGGTHPGGTADVARGAGGVVLPECESDAPDLHVVSNVLVDDLPIGIQGSAQIGWHSDMVAFLVPPAASLLHALEVPGSGRDTSFCNMYLAWDTLPPKVKRRLVGLTMKHEVSEGSADSGTGASHPAVWTHPETGCNALALGAGHNTHFNELPRQESDLLVEYLWAHSMQREFIWRHRWQPGDLVVWDNRCLLHRRESFDPKTRRVLLRTQVAGGAAPATSPDALVRPPHPRGIASLAN